MIGVGAKRLSDVVTGEGVRALYLVLEVPGSTASTYRYDALKGV